MAVTEKVVELLTMREDGTARKEETTRGVACTVSEVEEVAVLPWASVTVATTENVPIPEGVQVRLAVFEEPHPGGSPLYA